MKMFTRPLLIFVITILVLGVNGQIRRAERLMFNFDYHKAGKVLQKAITSKDTAIQDKAVKLLATCYRMQNDITSSKEWYGKIIRSGKADTMDYLYYGQALRSSGEYDKAREMFLAYATMNPKDPLAVLFAAWCDSVAIWKNLDPGFEIQNMTSLNSPQAEFSPAVYEKGLLFSSDRPNRQCKGKYQWTGNSYLGLFYAEQINEGGKHPGYAPPELFSKKFNKDYHSGPVSFDSAYSQVFMTLTTLKKSNAKLWHDKFWIHHLKMFSSTKERDKFRHFEPFNLNSDHWSVGHPALSPDGKMLYFVSDMDGGYGGTDIWYTTMTEEGWGLAVNAGPVINTPGNEMFPFIALNGDLYFSSTGLPGFGGLDLFVAHKEGNLWKTPVNLGTPVNSSYDDFSINYNCSDSTGFFSSSRPGGIGSDDIYYMKMLPPKVYLTACVRDKSDGTPLPGSQVTVSNSLTKEVSSFSADDQGCFRMKLEKGIAYSVKAEHSGYQPGFLEAKYLNDAEAKNFISPKIIELEKVVPPPPPPPPPPAIASIFYDFDKSNIRADAQLVLDNLAQVMKEGNFSVEINTFCDSRGSDSYNDALSQRRAESVIKYLVGQGIDRSRITANGQGESNLVNKCKDKVPCTKAEHQANRRAEFKLIPAPGPATTPMHP